jgi:hypothetical protein
MQWAFVKLARQFPEIVEAWYADRFYPILSKFLRFLLGWIPFSAGDLLYAALVIWCLRILWKFLQKPRRRWKVFLFRIGALCSVVFFLFHFNWAMNYHREPLPDRLGLTERPYDTVALIDLTELLIGRANSLQLQLAGNDTVKPVAPAPRKVLKKGGVNAYERLHEAMPEFEYRVPSIKHSLFSLPLTYMGFAGYLNPLTNEAQVNSMIPLSSYPATLCHEMAHQIGIGSESEANFVGFLAAIHAEDPYFRYSGYLMALRYCLSDVYRSGSDTYDDLIASINPGILKDFRESRAFWLKYQNFSEKHFKSVYDSYLKANRQKGGISSYNQMVGLLVNYHAGKGL